MQTDHISSIRCFRPVWAWSLPILGWILLCAAFPVTAEVERPPICPDPDSTGAGRQPLCEPSRLFPPRMSTAGFVYLPKVYYREETSFGLGGQIMRPLRLSNGGPETRISDIRLNGQVTFKGQSKLELVGNLYWGEGRYSVKSKIAYNSLPRRFWGLGSDAPAVDEEVYRPQDVRAYLELYRRVLPGFKLGLRYEYERLMYLEREPGGLLATLNYPGVQGRAIYGAGLLAELDTRDRRFSPTSGSFFQAFALFFDEHLGSEHDFNNYLIDLRHYRMVASNRVVALQFFVYEARGGAPIWRYAALGGREHSRGYRLERYLNRTLLAFQGEYRYPLWWRFRGVLFAGLANVASDLSALKLETLRPTIGTGLRFNPRTTEKIRVRLDLAFGESSARLYLALGDSF